MPRLRVLPCITLLLVLTVTLTAAPPALAATPSTQSTPSTFQWAVNWLGTLLTFDLVTADGETFPNEDPNGITTTAPVPSGDGTETYSVDPPEGDAFPNEDPDG